MYFRREGNLFRALFIYHDVGFYRTQGKNSFKFDGTKKTKLLFMEEEWQHLHQNTMFDLQLLFNEDDSNISGWFEYNSDLFDKDTIQRVSKFF